MNANGMARGYMAKNMDVEKFSKHVLHCVKRELDEWGYQAEIIQHWEQASLLIVFHINKDIFSLKLERSFIKQKQAQGPYALDRYIWGQIKNQEITLIKDHYMITVFGSEDI